MKQFLCLLLSISFLSVTSQTIEGYVVDSLSGNKLIFANLALNTSDIGTSTDVDGFFKLSLDAVKPKDSLLISYLGYKTKIFALSDLIHQKELLIALTPSSEQLSEVVISGKKTRYTNASYLIKTNKRKATFPSYGPFGREVATYIENPKESRGKIQELYLWFKYSKEEGFAIYEAYFRLTFLEINEEGFPGNYLSKKEIIIKPNGQKSLKIDLSSYDIVFPKNGFFVSLETINPSKNKSTNSIYLASPSFLYTHIEEKLVYSRYRGKKWHKTNRRSPFKKELYSVPFLKLKVRYEKQP
ncbi:MAG: carboxypeptidase-like regulatory domain-containing protein [Flavobacteriaceae bacterium]|nr:carboxypeptidase-like regulatory domain-containing protein [Flavobacteriaceae bacterium]